ncbi:hypothetical protein ACTXT7_016039 [Hymenolepis weldensis]
MKVGFYKSAVQLPPSIIGILIDTPIANTCSKIPQIHLGGSFLTLILGGEGYHEASLMGDSTSPNFYINQTKRMRLAIPLTEYLSSRTMTSDIANDYGDQRVTTFKIELPVFLVITTINLGIRRIKNANAGLPCTSESASEASDVRIPGILSG